jgi:ferric-dicitrate binding protein FerR (iron transport regulator)
VTDKKYTVSELVNNPSFQRMVKGTATPEESGRWSSWMEENDGNRKIAKTAISEIVGFEFRDPQVPDIEKEWSKLYSKTVGMNRLKKYQKRKRDTRLLWIVRIAAILLLASLVGVGVHYFVEDTGNIIRLEQLTEERTITTGNDEQKTLTFSNGSRIVLNRNTTLTYSLGVLHNQTVDVTLEGEAWFDVVSAHSKELPAFAVYTTDGVIRDIGTQFLVTVELGHTRVVLQEGIVEVEPAASNGIDADGESRHMVRLEPGEMLEFKRADVLRRERVNPTFFTAWATQFMQFQRTSIQDFAGYVEQRFGVNVMITDTVYTGFTLDGAVYFRSLEELVRSVSEVTGIPVYQSEKKDTVFIGMPG